MSKIKVKSITIYCAEGPTALCGKSVHKNWISAESKIFKIRALVDHDGYDKCDFTIVFEDGETYTGRYDAMSLNKQDCGLAGHVQRWLGFNAGTFKPAHVTEEKYKEVMIRNEKMNPGFAKECKEFLEKYDLN